MHNVFSRRPRGVDSALCLEVGESSIVFIEELSDSLCRVFDLVQPYVVIFAQIVDDLGARFRVVLKLGHQTCEDLPIEGTSSLLAH